MATNKELLEQVRTFKGKLVRASHEKRKLEEKNAALAMEIDAAEQLLINTRNNLAECGEKMLKAQKEAYDWQQAAEGLARKLEELKAQGKW